MDISADKAIAGHEKSIAEMEELIDLRGTIGENREGSSSIQQGSKLDSSNRQNFFRDPLAARDQMCRFLRTNLDHIGEKRRTWAKINQDWANKFCAVDWSQAFSEEGHLQLRKVYAMLPKLKPNQDDLSLFYFYGRLKSTVIALDDFNQRHKDSEYFLVKPIVAKPCPGRNEVMKHINFLAKPKKSSEAPVELFFAEIGGHSKDVTICVIVEHHLYPPGVTRPLENAVFGTTVIHPELLKCTLCNQRRRYI